MKKNFGVGILGCGMIAEYHAKAILELPALSLVGAFDVREESRRTFCQTYGGTPFSSAEALMESPSVDVICICLPSGFHFSYAMECIRRQKHIIIEKPMAFTEAEADLLIQAAEERGVQVAVISQLRYTDAVSHLKTAVEQAFFGKIVMANLFMQYYRSPEYYRSSNWKGTLKMDGGGALMNQGVHGIDLLQYLMGPLRSVQALSKTLCHSIEAEDTLSALVEFETGAIGTIQATTSIYPGFPRRLEICGTDGSATLCEDAIQSCHFRDPSLSLPCSQPKFDTGGRPDGMDHQLHKKQIADFVSALQNHRPPFVDAYEGKKSIRIIDAIYRSARSGEKIFL